MNRLERLLVSLFSESELVPSIRLKVPFTFSFREIDSFTFPDARLGGFGPVFGGALLLSAAVLFVLFWNYRRQLHRAASLLVLNGLIVLSALSFSEAWWARFAPQIWMVPTTIAITGILIVHPGKGSSLISALLFSLCLNNILIGLPYTFSTYKQNVRTAQQIALFKNQTEPIPVRLNDFAGIRCWLCLWHFCSWASLSRIVPLKIAGFPLRCSCWR